MEPTLTANEAAFAGGLFGGAFVAVMACAFVWGILMIIAGWKIFEKAGEPGWKVLIPIYDLYILYKIAGMKMWFWITLAVVLVCSIVIGAMGLNVNTIDVNSFSGSMMVPSIIYIVEMVFAFVVSVMLYARLSRAFGHGIGFTLGLVFLSGIFMLVLGFGKSKYDKKLVASWTK